MDGGVVLSRPRVVLYVLLAVFVLFSTVSLFRYSGSARFASYLWGWGAGIFIAAIVYVIFVVTLARMLATVARRGPDRVRFLAAVRDEQWAKLGGSSSSLAGVRYVIVEASSGVVRIYIGAADPRVAMLIPIGGISRIEVARQRVGVRSVAGLSLLLNDVSQSDVGMIPILPSLRTFSGRHINVLRSDLVNTLQLDPA